MIEREMLGQSDTTAGPWLLVRIYGDSLALPRESESVPPQATYAERFGRTLAAHLGARLMLYNRSRGGATVDVLYRDFQSDTPYFGVRAGGVLVIQCGIVDCAPRPIPGWARALLSKLPGRIRAPIVHFLHRNRRHILRAGFRFRYTSPQRFRRELASWIRTAAGAVDQIYVLSIAPTNDGTEERSPGLRASIATYNRIVAEVVHSARVAAAPGSANIELVDVHGEIERMSDGMSACVSPSDGHHITPLGHSLYADALMAAALGESDKENAAAARKSAAGNA